MTAYELHAPSAANLRLQASGRTVAHRVIQSQDMG
jgi:hypothetical protein